ncbi:MAG: FAD-dependent oxidoreductase, partial [Clostridia bacterium]|nr:FAD-dependent oxidoreductase [Clostridia bacterium]
YANACGLLKEEMRILGSLVIEAADNTKVPAGAALAVDRERFSAYITAKLKACPNLHLVCAELESLPDLETLEKDGAGMRLSPQVL